MHGKLASWLSCSVLLVSAGLGCSDDSAEARRLAVAAESLRNIITDTKPSVGGPLRDYRLPAYRRGLAMLEQPGVTRLEQPVLLVAIFTLEPNVRGRKPNLDLMWLESGFNVKGVYLEADGRVVDEFEVFDEWNQELRTFYSATAWRDTGLWVLLDDLSEDSLTPEERKQAGWDPIRVSSKVIASPDLRVGLILTDGRHTPAIVPYVVTKQEARDLGAEGGGQSGRLDVEGPRELKEGT